MVDPSQGKERINQKLGDDSVIPHIVMSGVRMSHTTPQRHQKLMEIRSKGFDTRASTEAGILSEMGSDQPRRYSRTVQCKAGLQR